jgi:hypothetical protein
MKTKTIRAASAEIICINKLRSCSTVKSKIIISVPQVLFLLLSTARPLMLLALTVLVKRAVPAQISITSKSCESMPENWYDAVAVACLQAPEKLEKEELCPTALGFTSDSVELSY